MSPKTGIITLAQRPNLAPIVADWVWEAFGRAEGGSREAYEAVTAEATIPGEIPQCFVLLIDGVPVGTASLVLHDCDCRPDLSPWLASVFVHPESRGQGYAARLVGAVEAAAVAARVETLWLYTETAERIYARLGWRRVEPFEHHGRPQVLMRKDLQGKM